MGRGIIGLRELCDRHRTVQKQIDSSVVKGDGNLGGSVQRRGGGAQGSQTQSRTGRLSVVVLIDDTAVLQGSDLVSTSGQPTFLTLVPTHDRLSGAASGLRYLHENRWFTVP